MMRTAADKGQLLAFIDYARALRGDEKGEAQVFCDRLFRGFGWPGYKEAGATLEYRVAKRGGGKKFADLVWRPRMVMEMKARGANLHAHYSQLFDYWLELVPHRPQYAVLCNFDEFWIYDFDQQLEEPMDRIDLAALPERTEALTFLLPTMRRPLFRNNRVDVTRQAADRLAALFNALVHREIPREVAQRFVLQCLVAMFSEDVGLLPAGLFVRLVEECEQHGRAEDLIGGLFRQMNSTERPRSGHFRDVPYFNGGIFQKVVPIRLNSGDLLQLGSAARENWAKVQPAIFGSLFQSSTDKKERHAFGAHFTSEADIQKVVRPTVLRPFRERLEKADSYRELTDLRKDLAGFRVLDPACGSGNFLYVAYRELRRLELEIVQEIYKRHPTRAHNKVATRSAVSTQQFFGIDTLPFAVDLAKVTLTLARELALLESRSTIDSSQVDLPGTEESALPLDNLDANIVCADALFSPWPEVDAIIGNPPFQSKNKMQAEYGRAYLNRLRDRYPDIPGRADYCVYWFRRAHEELAPEKRAGLVGTNTIRQNYSRQGGLDFILANAGTITEAVSTQVWSGDAAVHVSIVNWVRGKQPGKKRLYTQVGDQANSPWRAEELNLINSALSFQVDVSAAAALDTNARSRVCYQGQTHGHDGFLVDADEAQGLLRGHPEYREVLYPYLTADELLSRPDRGPARLVIDFHPRDVNAAAAYKDLFARVKDEVLTDREKAACKEEERNRVALEADPEARINRHHTNFLNKWWLLSYPREELITVLRSLGRYVACSRVTKRPIFEFISSYIRPNDSLAVFALADDYSFGVLQSRFHWEWFKARCSTLEERFRYTSNTVFDSFCWPQLPTEARVSAVAGAAVRLRQIRLAALRSQRTSLRELYRTLELPGANPLKDAHEALDAAVAKVYGFRQGADLLAFLLDLNAECAAKERDGRGIVGPGLPPFLRGRADLSSGDCVTWP